MRSEINQILATGATINPPRSVTAIAWLLCGLRNQSEIAALIGVNRRRLHDSPEFEDFRSEWKRLHGKQRQAETSTAN